MTNPERSRRHRVGAAEETRPSLCYLRGDSAAAFPCQLSYHPHFVLLFHHHQAPSLTRLNTLFPLYLIRYVRLQVHYAHRCSCLDRQHCCGYAYRECIYHLRRLLLTWPRHRWSLATLFMSRPATSPPSHLVTLSPHRHQMQPFSTARAQPSQPQTPRNARGRPTSRNNVTTSPTLHS